jgi:hypothetical protein
MILSHTCRYNTDMLKDKDGLEGDNK